MDKLTFYENLEPFDETREAAQLLGELASIKETIKETKILPPEIEKPLVSAVEKPITIIEPQTSGEDEIVSAKVEELTSLEHTPQILEPVEPYIPEEEIERMASMDLQPEMPSFAMETVPVEEKPQNNTPILIHTLESQQEYAREITKSEEPVEKKNTLEESYFNEDQESAIFEDKMVVEHTQPKQDAAQYLKEDLPETEFPSAKSRVEAKKDTLTEKTQVEVPEKQQIKLSDSTYDAIESEISPESEKIVLDMPAEAPSIASEEFYTIDQSSLPETDTISRQYSIDDEIRMGTLPSIEKDDGEISFKDTDSYKLESIKEKVEAPAEKSEDSASAYTEITLQGEIPDTSLESAQPLKPDFVSSQKSVKSIKSSLIDIKLPDKDLDHKTEASEEFDQEIQEKALQEKLSSFLPEKEKLSSELGDKIQEEKDSKAPALHFGIEKHALELEELLSNKTHLSEATESPEFAGRKDSLPPSSSLELKESEISKQDEEYRAVVLPFEDIKTKSPVKAVNESKMPDLPPFDFPTESKSSIKKSIESASDAEHLDKQKASDKKKKDTQKNKAEIESYESILAEAQKEAEEFIKDKIQKKEKQAIQVPDSTKRATEDQKKPSESLSFSDFLAKVKLQKPEKQNDSESDEVDHSYRPTLEKSHIPDDIADKLPIVQPEISPRGPVDLSMDLSVKPSSSEISDLKYDSVPLNSDEKEEPVKEPKLKSLISKLLKKKDKDEKIE